MPMIDVFAQTGTFADPHRLAVDLATAVTTIQQVPDIRMFRKNTAAFVHELPLGAVSNVDGESNYVRVQVLTNAGALDRDKQLAVVRQLTDIVAVAGGDPALADRTWVVLTEAVPPAAGAPPAMRTPTTAVAAARAEIAATQAPSGRAGAANDLPEPPAGTLTGPVGSARRNARAYPALTQSTTSPP